MSHYHLFFEDTEHICLDLMFNNLYYLQDQEI